ncbi:uncharacterized protein EI90DRAFT_3038238 [Cantharellus anzutake]|uniref:uncharacterized protein n=1 Tax=Cantharellus anzutake TaxID=1750568 RepID=UPI001907FC70|nr:uncharacterized protein EI90DRAFT_3038238 [Cantharellus anzutake]KAF8339894.1 hypothetical protein EI90DRAFT_3038238 [Cantharellus anzutake]
MEGSTKVSFLDGDVTLISSDGSEFRVHKLILSLASPFFSDMFKLPRGESRGALQSITMREDAKTLDALLKIVYPIQAEDVDLEVAISVYRAAEKLQMLKVSSVMRQWFQSILATLENPLEAWAIAVQLNLRQFSKDAEIRFIRANTKDCFDPWPNHLNAISVENYASLINRKERVIEEARSGLMNALKRGCVCQTCANFADIYASLTHGLNPFDPACTSLVILRRCYERVISQSPCMKWKNRIPPNETDQEEMQLKVKNVLSSVGLSAES